MRKITILILPILLIGCSTNNPKETPKYPSTYQVEILEIKGHEYLLSHTTSSYGGTCMIHSHSCPCLKTKQK